MILNYLQNLKKCIISISKESAKAFKVTNVVLICPLSILPT